MVKFGVLDGFEEAFLYIKRGFRRFLLNWFILVLVIVIPMALFGIYTLTSNASAYKLNLVYFIVSLCVSLIFGLIMQALLIKITDDIIESRRLSYFDQLRFVLKRSQHIIISNLLIALPILIILFMMVQTVTGYMSSSSSGSLLFYSLILLFYSVFTVMVNQAIIMEDLNAVDGIKRSFEVMRDNYFKYLGLMVLYVILSIIIQSLMRDVDLVIVILKMGVDTCLAVYSVVFASGLFKQVSDTPDRLKVFDTV